MNQGKKRIDPRDFPNRDSFYDACWAAMTEQERADYLRRVTKPAVATESAPWFDVC